MGDNMRQIINGLIFDTKDAEKIIDDIIKELLYHGEYCMDGGSDGYSINIELDDIRKSRYKNKKYRVSVYCKQTDFNGSNSAPITVFSDTPEDALRLIIYKI